jgi:hypothetical protein
VGADQVSGFRLASDTRSEKMVQRSKIAHFPVRGTGGNNPVALW